MAKKGFEDARKLKEFAKAVRDAKQGIERTFYTDVSPVLSNLNYDKTYSHDELNELINSIDEALESCGECFVGCVNTVDKALLKAKLRELELQHGDQPAMLRGTSGRKALAERKNDSGIYSTDSTFLGDPTEHDENRDTREQPDTRTFSEVACELVTSPTDMTEARSLVSHDKQDADSLEA